MLDLSQFFISPAMAQTVTSLDTGTTQNGNSIMSTLTSFAPLILIFMVFYILIIRPQQKKIEAQEKMVKALQRGDRVITSGGIHGKISRLEQDAEHVMLEIADGMHIKIARAHIAELAAKPTPAASDSGAGIISKT